MHFVQNMSEAFRRSVVLLSPAINLCADSPSWSDHRGIDYGDPSYILAWNRQYAGSLALDDPRVSPLNGNVAGLPRLLVVAGAAELLVDDARALVAKARAAGVTSEIVLGEDMVHAYASFGTLTPCAEAALRAITDFMAPPRPGAPPDPHQ